MFDAIYPTRPFHNNFEKFSKNFRYKELSIEDIVKIETNIEATKSVNSIIPKVRNSIYSIDFDSLNLKKKDELIDQIEDDLKKDTKIDKRYIEFVLNAFKFIKDILRTETKNMILAFCNQFLYDYLHNQNYLITTKFEVIFSNKPSPTYSSYIQDIDNINNSIKLFTKNDSHDFHILRNLLAIIEFGYANINNFSSIKFYTRDGPYEKKFQTFKSHVNTKRIKDPFEIKLDQQLTKVDYSRPY